MSDLISIYKIFIICVRKKLGEKYITHLTNLKIWTYYCEYVNHDIFDEESFRYILTYSSDQAIQEALITTCGIGNIETVKILLSSNRIIISSINRSICSACFNDKEEILSLLLKNPDVDPTTRDNYAINIATKMGYTNIVKLLLDDPRINKNDFTVEAPYLAYKHGHAQIIELLSRY